MMKIKELNTIYEQLTNINFDLHYTYDTEDIEVIKIIIEKVERVIKSLELLEAKVIKISDSIKRKG